MLDSKSITLEKTGGGGYRSGTRSRQDGGDSLQGHTVAPIGGGREEKGRPLGTVVVKGGRVFAREGSSGHFQGTCLPMAQVSWGAYRMVLEGDKKGEASLVWVKKVDVLIRCTRGDY